MEWNTILMNSPFFSSLSLSGRFCPTGLLSPTMPFPPQGPQGPMGFGQPRPPLMGYGGMFSDGPVFP